MKKYDCTKTLDYNHEAGRLCDSHPDCLKCPLYASNIEQDTSGCIIGSITEESIDIVQMWSDEHSEKTRAEAFLERIPTFRLTGSNRPDICWSVAAGLNIDCVGVECKNCWNEPYNGEFEKEAKKDEEI